MSADAYPRFRSKLSLLAGCWALTTTCNLLLVTASSLTGYLLAEEKSLAALPIAAQWLGTAAFTLPASFIMRAIGRKGGFLLAVALIASGAGIAVIAITRSDFWLFAFASMLIGSGNGFTWYYRFAAAEVSPENYRSRAIAWVLAGGLVAAVVGPTLANVTRDLLMPVPFAGIFLAIAVLQMGIAALLWRVEIPMPDRAELHGGRPILEIARQPKFIVAVMGGVIAYGIMVLLMSITPLAMEKHKHGFSDATEVIRWHVLGMYIPSFFSGHLIRRFGVYPIMIMGGFAMLGTGLVGGLGTGWWNFWTALTLLGVGWNFLYVGATTLLTETYTTAERARAQGLNEMLVFTFTGLGTFASGIILETYGWLSVASGVLLPVALVTVAVAWLGLRERRIAA